MGEPQISSDNKGTEGNDRITTGFEILPSGNVVDLKGNPVGYISPLSCIGQPPEHRIYRWLILERKAFCLMPIIHPTAIVEAFVTVDAGITTATKVGKRTILMKHSHVGHDAWIGETCNIAPGAIIGGHCKIGNFVKVGLNASIRPRVIVGNNAVIGAGAVVVSDVPAGEVWAGNPAKSIKTPKTDDDIWMEWWEQSRNPTPHLEGA